MKILHIITSLGSGGAEQVLQRIVTSDRYNDHSVVCLRDPGFHSKKIEQTGVSIKYLGLSSNPLSLIKILRLFHIIRERSPDIVQTWMYHADLIGGCVARMVGVKKVVWGIRGPFDRRRTKLGTKIVIYICAGLSRLVPSTIVVNSNFSQSSHIRAGYVEGRFLLISNGVPIDHFKADTDGRKKIRSELGVSDGDVIIGMAGRYDPYKDHINLLDALQILKYRDMKFTCLIFGSRVEPTNSDLMKEIERRGLLPDIILLGERSDVSDLMTSLDLHILSSAAESFPNAVLEAMACEVPCVVTDVGDTRRIVKDSGFIVAPENAEELANAIALMIKEIDDQPAWCLRKSRCRDIVVSEFSLEIMIGDYQKLWARL